VEKACGPEPAARGAGSLDIRCPRSKGELQERVWRKNLRKKDGVLPVLEASKRQFARTIIKREWEI